jgi:hypothetical protein
MPVVLSGTNGVTVQGMQFSGAPGGAVAFYAKAIHDTTAHTLKLSPRLLIVGTQSNSYSLTISQNTTVGDLRTYALAQGWDGTLPLLVTINSGIIVGGTGGVTSGGNGGVGLTIAGSFPAGVTIINNGYIVGGGGAGGYSGSPGGAGGAGISASAAVAITNNGTIAGGGGGGGGSGQGGWGGIWVSGGGGGGGRSSHNDSGYGQTGGVNGGTSGTNGTFAAAGTGGAGSRWYVPAGNGGDWGTAGFAGTASYDAGALTPGAGGAAGNCIIGNSFITWNATGTRVGTIA